MILGLSGFAGVGKDTVADILVRDHGFVKVAIADPLKRVARDIFDFTDEQLWGPSAMREQPDTRYQREHTWRLTAERGTYCICCGVKPIHDLEHGLLDPPGQPCYLTPRYALQLLGTEYGRHCYDSIWIELALRTARTIIQKNMAYSQKNGIIDGAFGRVPGVVLPDVRFRNELDGIKKFGKHHDELVLDLIEQWHSQPRFEEPRRQQHLHEFLNWTSHEYEMYVGTSAHPLSAHVIRVTRDGFEKPRYQHQSELEQLSFHNHEFDYVFVGGETLDGIDKKVTNMLGVLA
jgi:hypothetical protein